MKTIQVGNNGNRTVWTLLLVAGLGALYFYQRRGGKVSTLIQSGYRGVTAAREKLGQIAPSVTAKGVTARGVTTGATAGSNQVSQTQATI